MTQPTYSPAPDTAREAFSPQAVREHRARAGLTREQVAAQLGKSFNSIVLWESGGAVPGTAVLTRLAALLGCRVGDLFLPIEPE